MQKILKNGSKEKKKEFLAKAHQYVREKASEYLKKNYLGPDQLLKSSLSYACRDHKAAIEEQKRFAEAAVKETKKIIEQTNNQ